MQMTISAVLRYVTDSAGIYRVGNSIGIVHARCRARSEVPKSSVAYVIKKWKVSGDCPECSPSRQTNRKLGDRTDECSPEKFGRAAPNRWPLIPIIVSMNTIRKEAHLHGFMVVLLPISLFIHLKSNRAAILMWRKKHIEIGL
ncbi:hypothetical protein CEXT_607701 [Caerostris extrusa]|uniref:Uncharacterized protein n=1 Tax=Caerostris extrusa TaxID=172846 RepID=A0AAV4R8V8_CAEEX|nr:hypothetical protein CEXT_607701 [Caerostris extrusa]